MAGDQKAWAGAMFALLLASALPVRAGAPTTICTNLPRYGWVSSEEIEAQLKRAGYQLLRLRITNEACYAALVVNAAGKRQELLIHPGTSEVLPEEIPTSAVHR